MENQYYTLVEKQDFYEIIENKFGELAIFIDEKNSEPQKPLLEYDGKETAVLKRDMKVGILLDNITKETGLILAELEHVMIVELIGETVERVYGVPVETVDEFSFKGRKSRANELERVKSRSEVIESFGAINIWKSGENK